MSTEKTNVSTSTAATTMMSQVTDISKSNMESVLKDHKVDKHAKLETVKQYRDQIKKESVEVYTKESRILLSQLIFGFKGDKELKYIKLEALIQYLEQIKNQPIEVYMKEARFFLSELEQEFQGDKDYFLLWVRFLDVAYVHKMNKVSAEEEEAFKRGIKEIFTGILLKNKTVKSTDWRIALKILSLNNHFSLIDDNQKQVEEGILKAFRAEIDIALDHLLWKEESLFVTSTKTTLISLRNYLDSSADQGQEELLEALLCGRFDREKFNLKNSLILGEDGGLYMLINRMNQQQQDALIAEKTMTADYLKDKIKPKDEDTGAGKDDRIVLGAGGFGTVRFALSLFRTRSLPAEIVCVKKTKSFQDLTGSFKPSPLERVTQTIIEDYFTNERAKAIYSPFILDMTLVTSKKVIKDDAKDHRKGYLIMEVLPKNTATRIFADEQYQTWEYQKPYLLDVLENTQKLLESNTAMTDLKPDNTLYDTDTRKATIIDLGGSVKVAKGEELIKFDLSKHSIQSTPAFRAEELAGTQGVINMHQAIAYSCGKVIEAITLKSGDNQETISQIVKKLTASEPEARTSIRDAIDKIKLIGNSDRENYIFSHYINKVLDRLENKKSAISINEDIDKTRKCLITLNATSSDPAKYKDLRIEDLFNKIDGFLASGNSKQVMAIFGVAGSGKSIALQLKFIKAVEDWKVGQPLPIYFNLANGLDLDQIVRTLNTELGTNLDLECLKGQHLYIDSFDEGLGIEHKKETLIKEYLRQLQGSAKIIITCRTDYLQEDSYDWFSPEESKELEVCYVAPINYNSHQDLRNMVDKYVFYSKQTQHTTQDYLDRLKKLQLTDLINTGFMFVLIMDVLFELEDKKERRVNQGDIYASYTSYYQKSRIAELKNEHQKKRLQEITPFSKSNQQSDLCSFATELGKYLACQMHLRGQARLGESDLDKLFAALGYDNSLLLKHQTIIHLLRLLPLKIVTTHSGKRVISNQEVKIGFIHETVKNYYLLEAIKDDVEKEDKSGILASKSVVHDGELVKLMVLAMKDHPKLSASFVKAIESSKQDKSTASTIHAANSISLLVAAEHSFAGSDLSNIAVNGANIVNGIFHNANLNSANLSGVDMSNVNLKGASLEGANMRGVNFSILPDLAGHNYCVNSVRFSPDGKFLASGSFDDTIKIWNPSTGECLQTLSGHNYGVNSVCFSHDGKFFASGSGDGTIMIWNPSTGRCLKTLNEHTGDITSITFSPDGKFLASASYDKTIKIWNPNTEGSLQTLNGHSDKINSVSFSPDGSALASGSGDGTIMIWNPSTFTCLKTLNEHTGSVTSVSFSSDGKFLVSGSEDSTIKIWNSKTGQCLQTLKGHTSPVLSIRFSTDGNFLASGSQDKTIKIWNPRTGDCLQTINGHNSASSVFSVDFSPDDKFLASASYDQTIQVFKFKALSSAWLLQNNIAATLSPLLADGANLKKTIISQNNRLILMQKGADTEFSAIDNTQYQNEHHIDTSPESNSIADQRSQIFLKKFISQQQTQGSKLVTLSGNLPACPDEKHLNNSSSDQHQQCQDPKPVAPSELPPLHDNLDNNRRSTKCCQIFVMPKIIYDNPLLNNLALFTQISQTLGPIETLNLTK